MSDAFNESWALLKRRRNTHNDNQELNEYLSGLRRKDPAVMVNERRRFERQMAYALENENYDQYESIRNEAEAKLGLDMATEAAQRVFTSHLISQAEEERRLNSVDDKYLDAITEELDEAEIKDQQKEQPHEMIARQNREVEEVGGPERDIRQLVNRYERDFSSPRISGHNYRNMRATPFEFQTEMMIHHMLTPNAPALSLQEFQHQMSDQLGERDTLNVVNAARSMIDEMSDAELEQRTNYAEAGGSPGAAVEVLGEFEDAMLQHMLEMSDPSQRDGSQASNNLEELTNDVGDLFGSNAANMMRERAIEAHYEATRLSPDHPARMLPQGEDRLPPHWRIPGQKNVGPAITQLGLQEFDRNNAPLTPEQRDDIRYLANILPSNDKTPFKQREALNRRIEVRGGQRGGRGDSYTLVADDEKGKSYPISNIDAATSGNLISNLMSQTEAPFYRQKGYRDLLMGLLNAGFNIRSDSRNSNYSNPFHANLIQNLPPRVSATVERGDKELTLDELKRRQAIIDQGGPLARRYDGYGSRHSSLPIRTDDKINYSADMSPVWGDLRPDSGALPIVNIPEKTVSDSQRSRAEYSKDRDDNQMTFKLPGGRMPAHPLSIAQRAMGMSYERGDGSLLLPFNLMHNMGRGNHGHYVDRNDVPFPSPQDGIPPYTEINHLMTPEDYEQVYGSAPTREEMNMVRAASEIVGSAAPIPLTPQQILAIQQLPSMPPPPQPEEKEERNIFDFDDLGELFG